MDLDGIFRQYLEYIRRWGIAATLELYRRANPDDLDGTLGLIGPFVAQVYGQATVRSLTATDEYLGLVAAWNGLDYRSNWTLGRPDAPARLPNGQLFAEWMALAPAGVKALIASGMDPAEALEVSRARAAQAVAGGPIQQARSTVFNRFVADSLVAERNVNPASLRPWTDEVEVYANLWDGQRRREYPGSWQRYQRVPSPGACNFCLMLATRSDYTSADAALYAGGAEGRENAMSRRAGGGLRRSGVSRRTDGVMESGDRYHKSCRCTVRVVAKGSPAAIAPDDLERLMTPDADGNLPVLWGNTTAADVTWDTSAVGIPMPERAPWAKDWSSAPRFVRQPAAV